MYIKGAANYMGITKQIIRMLEKYNKDKILDITTVGRKSKLPRKVTVGFVCFNSKLFLRTSHRTEWYKNLITTPKLKLIINSEEIPAIAKPIRSQELIKILQERYYERYKLYDIYANLIKLRGDKHFFQIYADYKVVCR